jgi:hypothetical protein
VGKVKTIEDYEAEIRDIHRQLKDYPDSETLNNKLDHRLTKWASLMEVTVFVANNEQKPFTMEEIGYPTRPMLTKKEYEKMYGKGNGVEQVADYQAYIRGGSVATWCLTLVERKGDDLYSTLMNSDNRARFYREIDRFRRDSRFEKIVVLTDWTLDKFISFVPPFCGKTRNTNHIGACVESRYGTIASLYIQDVPILFCGSRARAAKMYHKLIQQDIIKNYVKYLMLYEPVQEQPVKLIEEDHDTLTFLADGTKFRVLKVSVEVLQS